MNTGWTLLSSSLAFLQEPVLGEERKKGGAGGGDSPSRESWMGGVVGAGSDTKEWPGKVESCS